MTRLYRSTRKARRQKRWADVLPVLDAALQRQPENRDIRYHRSWMRALTGNPDGALADLEVLLLAHYPKYASRVAADQDFASLHKPPYKARLAALLDRARKAHVKAWGEAVFFIAGSRRAYRLGSRVAGSQEVYAYHPKTGRYLGVTYNRRANVLAFLTDGRGGLVYVTASRLRTDAEPLGYADLAVHAMSLTTGRLLKSIPAEPPEQKAPSASRARPAMQSPRGAERSDGGAPPPVPGFSRVELNLRQSGHFHVVFERKETEQTRGRWHVGYALRVGPDKVQVMDEDELRGTGPDDAREDEAETLVELWITPCGVTRRSVAQARAVRETVGRLPDGKTVKCPGLLWRTDRGHAIYQPYRYCKKPPHGVRGLYLVTPKDIVLPLTPDHEARQVLWLRGEREALLQIGHRLAYVNLVRGAFKLLAPPAAFIQAYAPHIGPCR